MSVIYFRMDTLIHFAFSALLLINYLVLHTARYVDMLQLSWCLTQGDHLVFVVVVVVVVVFLHGYINSFCLLCFNILCWVTERALSLLILLLLQDPLECLMEKLCR